MEQYLISNNLVTDCYIGQYSKQQKQQLTAWVELNNEGIEVFRSKGRKEVIEQLKQHLAKNQENSDIPRFWLFTAKLPRDSQSKINHSDFEQACAQVQTDPIWLDSYIVEDVKFFKGRVPLDLVFFKGHFPQFPLVPGVIEVQWVIDKITEFFAEEKNILRIDNLKFQKFLRPNDELELTLKWNKEKSRMEFQLKTDNETCGKGLVVIA